MQHNKIKELMKKPLSGDDVMKIAGNKSKVLTYPQLSKYQTIDEVLGKDGTAIILYQTSNNYGHWVGLLKRGNRIEIFDPIGVKPDDELKFINKHYRKVSNQHHPHLSYLLYNSPYAIEYNHDKLQKDDKNVSTCGRHVGLRIRSKNIPLTKYVKSIKESGMDTDYLVTGITSIIV